MLGAIYKYVRILLHATFSQLVDTDRNFQAVYDAVMIQLVLFVFYFIIRDCLKAQR